MNTNTYAGQSRDERIAARKQRKQNAQEQPGGSMAVEGTEPDTTHSSGELSDEGKKVWRTGAGLDGGGKRPIRAVHERIRMQIARDGYRTRPARLGSGIVRLDACTICKPGAEISCITQCAHKSKFTFASNALNDWGPFF